MYFRLKKGVGNHSQKDSKGNVVIFESKDGKLIETDDDLCEMFPDKFEQVDTPSASLAEEIEPKKKKKPKVKIKKKKAKDEEDDSDEDEEEDEEDEEQEPLGKDSTSKFKRAKEEDFKVFYAKGKGYFVTEAEDPFTSLNKKGLKKDKVTKYIEKLLKE